MSSLCVRWHPNQTVFMKLSKPVDPNASVLPKPKTLRVHISSKTVPLNSDSKVGLGGATTFGQWKLKLANLLLFRDTHGRFQPLLNPSRVIVFAHTDTAILLNETNYQLVPYTQLSVAALEPKPDHSFLVVTTDNKSEHMIYDWGTKSSAYAVDTEVLQTTRQATA